MISKYCGCYILVYVFSSSDESVLIFFFKQKTAYEMRISDWSSDVCSSDLRMDAIYRALAQTDLFVSIGTSGAVYPAAGFVREARASGARTLELNMEPSEGSHWFDEARRDRKSVA